MLISICVIGLGMLISGQLQEPVNRQGVQLRCGEKFLVDSAGKQLSFAGLFEVQYGETALFEGRVWEKKD